MVVYYINSKGEKLDLLQAPYRVVDADWFDSEWETTSDGYERTVNIDVFGKKSEFKQNMEKLYKIIAVDSELGVYGKLYVNDTYLRCNIQTSKKTGWKGFVYSEVELKFHAPVLKWVQEVRKSFFIHGNTDVDGLNFPFNFPFNFTQENRGTEIWKIDHIIPNDFEMVIYGPCENPKIFINGYPYEVLASLQSNEYMVINSVENTVLKYCADGATENLFNERGFEHSVFEKIPSGMLTITWTGEFGFDLILYVMRREPLW